MIRFLQNQPDDSLIDWGRHVSVNGIWGQGPAQLYQGEAAEVLKLVVKHSKGGPPSEKEKVQKVNKRREKDSLR